MGMEVAQGGPAVSIIMGVYYRRENTWFLQRSVDSILSQTFQAFEFLICDDGSNDIAKELLERYARQDSRIRLIRFGNKLDLASKLNACLQEARGVYIGRMDDDDASHPIRLEKQLMELERHPDMAFTGCNVNIFQAGEMRGVRRFPQFPQVRDFYFSQPFIHPTLLFRCDPVVSVNGYSENPRQILCEDYDLLLRLYAAGYFGMNVQEPLLDYTVPSTAKGSRTMRHRWNEVVTRYARFQELGQFPGAAPYVVKPLLVGLIPEPLLQWLKRKDD